jgi:hypothetical protein
MAITDVAEHLFAAFKPALFWAAFIVVWIRWCPKGWQDAVAVGLFLAGLIAGWLGFLHDIDSQEAASFGWLQCAGNALHSTLQLIVLNVDAEKTQELPLSFARIALPLATAQVLLSFIAERLTQWQLRFRLLQLFGFGVGVLVLGSGRTGLLLAKYYDAVASKRWWKLRRAPIGVDQHLDTANVLAFREHFAVLQEPLHDPKALKRLSLEKREHIVICTGNDLEDIELTRRIARLPSLGAETRITVSIESAAIPRACRLDPDLAKRYANGSLRFFHAQHTIARILLLSHAPHLLHEKRFEVGAPNSCHIAVCGDGSLVEELVAQAVRALVYSVREPLRITVLVPNAPERERAFFARFPALAHKVASTESIYGQQLPLALIAFVESSAEQINASALRAVGPLDAIYAMGRNDGEARVVAAEAIKVVMTMPEKARAPVVACLESSDVAAGPFETIPPAARLKLFASSGWVDGRHELQVERSMTSLPDELADDIAMRLWWAYTKSNMHKYERSSFDEERARKEWPKQPHHEHSFNRYAADHAMLKLELLGLPRAATLEQVKAAVHARRAWLSELEHRRYVRERVVDGWLASPYEDTQDESATVAKANYKRGKHFLLNYTIQPFATLPGSERDKDVEIVMQIAETLKALSQLREGIQRKS